MKSPKFLIIVLVALALGACEGMTAQYNEPDVTVQSDAGPSPDAGSDTDSGSPDTSPDAQPDTTPETTAPVPCVDSDKDGYCTHKPDGTLFDCNDSNVDADGDGIVDGYLVHPGAVETCDLIDNNCNGQVDEGLEVVMNYADTDNDGFGDINDEGAESCVAVGFVTNANDCNDSDPDTHPGAEDEGGDGIDSDCDDETSPEDSLDVIALSGQATLTVNFAKEDKLELNVWLLDAAGEVINGSYEGPWASAAWANSIGASFQITDKVATVRFNVTVGGGGNITWLCVGNGDTATVLEGASATLELPEGFELLAPDFGLIFSDPSGNGCGVEFKISLK